jgi:uncharacterized protein YggE
MVRTLFFAGALIAASALITPALADEVQLAPGEILLQVQTSGASVVPPDAALITAGVVSTGTTAREATDANAVAMTKVIAAIREAGVGERQVRTQQLSVQPRFARGGANDYQGQAQITGYVAQNNVAVTVVKLATASNVIAAAFAAGANSVNGPNLQLQDDSGALTMARRDAIANARAEAETYAEGLGMRVVRVLRVSERGESAQPIDFVTVTAHRLTSAPSAPPPPPPVAGGEMRQTVTLWIDYALAAK